MVEVRDDPGWGVLLDGQLRVVVCGDGTPAGVDSQRRRASQPG